MAAAAATLAFFIFQLAVQARDTVKEVGVLHWPRDRDERWLTLSPSFLQTQAAHASRSSVPSDFFEDAATLSRTSNEAGAPFDVGSNAVPPPNEFESPNPVRRLQQDASSVSGALRGQMSLITAASATSGAATESAPAQQSNDYFNEDAAPASQRLASQDVALQQQQQQQQQQQVLQPWAAHEPARLPQSFRARPEDHPTYYGGGAVVACATPSFCLPMMGTPTWNWADGGFDFDGAASPLSLLTRPPVPTPVPSLAATPTAAGAGCLLSRPVAPTESLREAAPAKVQLPAVAGRVGSAVPAAAPVKVSSAAPALAPPPTPAAATTPSALASVASALATPAPTPVAPATPAPATPAPVPAQPAAPAPLPPAKSPAKAPAVAVGHSAQMPLREVTNLPLGEITNLLDDGIAKRERCGTGLEPSKTAFGRAPQRPEEEGWLRAGSRRPGLALRPTPLSLDDGEDDFFILADEEEVPTLRSIAPQQERSPSPAPSAAESAASAGGSSSEVSPASPSGAKPLPTVGSAKHATGECRRCNFFVKGRCRNGYDCSFCHFPHVRRKLSRQEKREAKLARVMAQQRDSPASEPASEQAPPSASTGASPSTGTDGDVTPLVANVSSLISEDEEEQDAGGLAVPSPPGLFAAAPATPPVAPELAGLAPPPGLAPPGLPPPPHLEAMGTLVVPRWAPCATAPLLSTSPPTACSAAALAAAMEMRSVATQTEEDYPCPRCGAGRSIA
mmetsp:Transcript_147021/g.409591  ORF Transcript_147021/g.409591 Transcript_147021/m.409591 type:complete len:735 (+) Transcript_147021:178-2382(+)